MGVFTLWKLGNATNLPFFSSESVVKHLPLYTATLDVVLKYHFSPKKKKTRNVVEIAGLRFKTGNVQDEPITCHTDGKEAIKYTSIMSIGLRSQSEDSH